MDHICVGDVEEEKEQEKEKEEKEEEGVVVTEHDWTSSYAPIREGPRDASHWASK